MRDFSYVRPTSIEEACDFLAEEGDAIALAGGQSLLPLLRLGAASPEVVIDLNAIEGAAYIDVDDGHAAVGLLARHADVAASSAVRESCLVLAEVAEHIGDMQVRNRGTICGSVAHGDPAGDPPVLAALLDAEIDAQSADGTSTYSGADFYGGFYETELAEDELVTEVRFPTVAAPTGVAYEKWEPSEGAYPVATVGALLELGDGIVEEARIVTGAIEPGPTPADEATEELEGAEPTEEALTDAAILVGDNADPIEDAEGSVAFKQELIKTLTKRALMSAAERARGGA